MFSSLKISRIRFQKLLRVHFQLQSCFHQQVDLSKQFLSFYLYHVACRRLADIEDSDLCPVIRLLCGELHVQLCLEWMLMLLEYSDYVIRIFFSNWYLNILNRIIFLLAHQRSNFFNQY